MKEQRIKVDGIDLAFVEKLYFEYEACLKILGFLTAREETKELHLNRYIDLSEKRCIELDLAKKEVSLKYQPEGIFDYSYYFDFDNEEIIYNYE